MPTPPHRPFPDRVEAGIAFNAHLLALLTGARVDLARRVAGAWFRAVRGHCAAGRVVVFDTVVVGRPDPLLLEVAHHAARVPRRSDVDCDGSDDLTPRSGTDPGACCPTTYDRVRAAMSGASQVERIVGWPSVDGAVARTLDWRRDDIEAVVDLVVVVEASVRTMADAIRIGEGAVVAPHPPGTAGQRWDDAA